MTAGNESAIADAEIVVLAVPYAAAREIVVDYGAQLDGKVVIDISNPVNASFDGLVVEPGTSAAEEIARLATPGARVVKAFNTTFAGTLVAGQVGGEVLDVFIAADEAAARKRVADFVESGGLNPVDVGALSGARALEGFQLLHMALQLRDAGHGWMSTIKVLAPSSRRGPVGPTPALPRPSSTDRRDACRVVADPPDTHPAFHPPFWSAPDEAHHPAGPRCDAHSVDLPSDAGVPG